VNAGATVQLQSTLWDRLHVLAGLRLGLVDMQGNDPFAQTPFHTVQSKLMPRFGVAYDVLPGVTPFFGYSEGLRAVRFFSGQGTPKPEEAQQIEAGVKLALPVGFAATLAVFDITRRNVVTGDPNNPFLQFQTGEQRSRGFDVTLTWNPLPGLSLWASYAHIDARVTEDPAISVGNRLERVPEDSGRIWANYLIPRGPLKNWSVGAGFYAASSQAISIDNRYITPGYVIFDAKIAYETDRWSFAVFGRNLTDRRYFIPYPYFQGRVASGEPLTVFTALTLKH